MARVSEKRNVNGVACSKANTRRPSRGWKNDVKLGVKEIEWDSGLDGFGSGWERVACCCGHSSGPCGSIKCCGFIHWPRNC